jgi:homoserine O-acetyltransferase/O-succinyltransferase
MEVSVDRQAEQDRRRAAAVRHHEVAEFRLDSGEVLRRVRQAYRLDGALNAARDNLVLIFHGLSADCHAVDGWWADVVGPGRAVDTRRWAVLTPNLLGSCFGTSYERDAAAANGAGAAPPAITVRDMVRLVAILVDALEVRAVALATGGSLGGMATLEWAASFPDRTRAAVPVAAPAAHTAHAIGWSHIQRRAVALGGAEGLALARMVGMMTYRTPEVLAARYGRDGVAGYLEHQGRRLLERFDPASYVALLDAMDAHDVGAGRGGIDAALASFRGRLIGVGIPGDQLYPDADVREWVAAAGAEYRRILSIHGHDAFLLEPEQMGAILEEALAAGDGTATAGARVRGALVAGAASGRPRLAVI